MTIKHMTLSAALGALACTSLSLALLPTAAHAALGEQEDSAQVDVAALKGQLHSSDQGLYRSSEIRAPSGVIVREYAAPSGKVFAVTWRGPTLPDLKQVLGPHYAEFAAASASAPRADRHHVRLHANDLVVQMSGHMRAFTGRAYLASEVPAGVSVRDLP
jgi:hypothetical protein